MNYTEIENNEALKAILENNFAEVSTELRKVLKTASKGERKGLLIFVPDAANQIHNIENQFVQYIVRSIYDNFQDMKNGIIFRMHFNEIFCGDFIKSIFRQLNSTVDNLENELAMVKEENKEDKEYSKNILKDMYLYSYTFKNRYTNNAFNVNNPISIPFYTAFNALKAKVKKEHSRVKDDKLEAFIDKDYTYREEYRNIEKNFLNSLPEYIELRSKIDESRKEHYRKEKEIESKIAEELSKLDYTSIKKCIQSMVDMFTGEIANRIIAGEI